MCTCSPVAVSAVLKLTAVSSSFIPLIAVLHITQAKILYNTVCTSNNHEKCAKNIHALVVRVPSCCGMEMYMRFLSNILTNFVYFNDR